MTCNDPDTHHNTDRMKRIRLLILLICTLSLFCTLSSCGETETLQKREKSLKGEQWYQTLWCDEQNGRAEVLMADKTRCDCITATHAIEVDFAQKWVEAIGQSLHYARLTGKEAGVLLILKDSSETKYASRLRDNINYFDLPIRVWTIDAADYKKKSRGTLEKSGSRLMVKSMICTLAAFSAFVASYCH